ncbi:GspE/PulE family protein [Acanthopleuribacter pedis]|uniref:Type II/IV secretion system protein n=1 Tax=Acanthopleuribacter pedis TaxID=442870 RepID=A0A8J7U5Y1_9BACT|nr:GspE/PulE family protein [Acanthopleuribacter pedis]MBO1323028.1 type II/IV secretion system protein [Acanthopleuribacter pedis]
MNVRQPHEAFSPAFLQDQRLLLEADEDGWLCRADQKLSAEVESLLRVACPGRLTVHYLDSASWHRFADTPREREAADDDQAEIVAWVGDLLREAVHQGASDIHLEPRLDCLQVRFRLDGRLQVKRTFGLEYRDALNSRIKVLADLDIAEKRRPQDGKIQMNVAGRAVDFRVSTIPTGKGEKVVIRVLDQSQSRPSIAGLGMPAAVETAFAQSVRRPHGLVLVTGPTGSGKTTTLYAALQEIRGDHLNITTIEDPIEYQIDGINQSQVRPGIGFGFSEALRSFLRQDPNVIMVGEIRDGETADMSIRASLTGHLVFSTLHTNSAPGAVPRLIDIGAEAYLVASSLQLVIAQRLVRRLCPRCLAEDDAVASKNARFPAEEKVTGTYWIPRGCRECKETGYRGRLGVFEALTVDRRVREVIHDGSGEPALQAADAAYRPMLHHGLALAGARETSLDELLREVVMH